MAKQSGITPISGTIGNMTGRHTQDGDIIQRKSSLTKERFLKDPAFAGSRGANNEFTIAAKGASLLRRVFLEGILDCLDNKLQSRLTTRLQKVIYKDMVSKKGEKNLLMGDIKELNGFWWNREAGIRNILGAHFRVRVERETGEVCFSIPSFVPKDMLKGTPGATHYKIMASGAEVDWLENGHIAVVEQTDYLKWDENATEAFNPVLLLTKESTLPIVSCLAVCWYQEVAGEKKKLFDMKYNTAGVVDVNTP